MDREVASHLAFDLSLGASLPLARMVGTEPPVRPMRLLSWGLFNKSRVGALPFPFFTINLVYELTLVMDRGRRKFSILWVVFKLREGLGLPANKISN